MVQVKILKTNWGYETIKATGHSEDPLVCSAISAIMWGLSGTLLNIDESPNVEKMIMQSGHFDIQVSPTFDIENQSIVDTAFLFAEVALRQISEKNPQNLEIIHI